MTVRKGIDVSAHQGKIDWEKVKQAGIDFAILRAGYGRNASQIDKRFRENYAACRTLGIPCGAYWYSYAVDTADVRKEAQAAIAVLRDCKLAYPVYFDIEDKTQLALPKHTLNELVRVFCDTMEQAGFFVGLYSYKSFLEQNFTEEILRRYAIWVAHTGVAETDFRYPFGMWQYSHTGKIAGISGKVDLNQGYLNYPNRIAGAHLNGY